MKKTKYLLAVGGVALLALAGCGKEKVTAEELVNGISQEEKNGVSDIMMTLNFEADMQIDESSTSSMALNAEIRVQSTEQLAHMDGNMKINILGMNMNEEVNTWYDLGEKKTYTYDADADEWYVDDLEDDVDYSIGNFENLDTAVFKELTLEEVDKNEDYKVTGTVDYAALKDLVGETDLVSELGVVDGDEDITMDVNMTFDRESKALKTMLFDIDPSAMSELEDVNVKTFQLGFDVYQLGGSLELVLSDDVKNNAVEAAAWDYAGDDFDEDDWSGDYGSDEIIWDEDMDTVKAQLLEDYPELAGTDGTIGEYAGKKIAIGGDYKIFIEDGWTVEDSEASYSFVSFDNEKYPDFDLEVYDFDWTGKESSLQETGIWGYEMYAYNMEDPNKLPPLNFKGLTWGASADELIAVYGEAHEVYDGAGYTAYTYVFGDCELTFHIYNEDETNPGLSSVAFLHY